MIIMWVKKPLVKPLDSLLFSIPAAFFCLTNGIF